MGDRWWGGNRRWLGVVTDGVGGGIGGGGVKEDEWERGGGGVGGR